MSVLSEPIHLEEIQLAPQPIGQGGEGSVFEILAPLSLCNYVAKIYHPNQRTLKRKEKLDFMMSNAPLLSDSLSVIWPEKILYESAQFAGFLMKKARGKYDLTVLSSLKIPLRIEPEWATLFSRHTQEGMERRARICFNIAHAVKELHESGQYVITDLKPENIKVNIQGLVSLIDMDSIEIYWEGIVKFPAYKCSPEYAPPELKKLNFENDFISESWDRFSLAVVFYKILLGLHPFAGTGRGRLDKLATLQAKIHAGLFVMGSRKSDFRIIPQPHYNFEALTEGLRSLFLQCFDEGIFEPSLRPKAADWFKQLQEFKLHKKSYHLTYTEVKPQTYQTHQDAQIFEIEKTWMNWNGNLNWIYWLIIYNYVTNATVLGHSFSNIWFLLLFASIPLLFGKRVTKIDFDLNDEDFYYTQKYLLGYQRIKKVAFDKLRCEKKESNKSYQVVFYKKGRFSGKKKLFSVKFKKIDPSSKDQYDALVMLLKKWKMISREVIV